VESVLRGMDTYLESMLPGGHFLALGAATGFAT
jgi:hypothetical protein